MILIVVAHPDDEVLGCGGAVAKWTAAGESVHILIMAEGITSRDSVRNVEAKSEEISFLAKSAQKAGNIVGAFLLEKDKAPLYRLVFSENLWERRIAIVATFSFIKNDEFDDTLKIAEILLTDKEDLIHKAVGWMLREVGKRVIEIEEEFLEEHYLKMPRTMLRYAIERFPETRRKMYLKGQI